MSTIRLNKDMRALLLGPEPFRSKVSATIGFQLKTPRFREVAERLVKKWKVTRIVETGTFVGQGSTQVWADTGQHVDTCEVVVGNYEQALENLEHYKNVHCHLAFTTSKSDCPKSMIDKLGDNAPAQENWLAAALVDNARQLKKDETMLIYLDSGSAASIGLSEIKVVIDFWQSGVLRKPIVLVMDDVENRKHAKSVEELLHMAIDVFQAEARWGFTILTPEKIRNHD